MQLAYFSETSESSIKCLNRLRKLKDAVFKMGDHNATHTLLFSLPIHFLTKNERKNTLTMLIVSGLDFHMRRIHLTNHATLSDTMNLVLFRFASVKKNTATGLLLPPYRFGGTVLLPKRIYHDVNEQSPTILN